LALAEKKAAEAEGNISGHKMGDIITFVSAISYSYILA